MNLFLKKKRFLDFSFPEDIRNCHFRLLCSEMRYLAVNVNLRRVDLRSLIFRPNALPKVRSWPNALPKVRSLILHFLIIPKVSPIECIYVRV